MNYLCVHGKCFRTNNFSNNDSEVQDLWKETQKQLEGRSVEHTPPPVTKTFQNLITSFPVAKGISGRVW